MNRHIRLVVEFIDPKKFASKGVNKLFLIAHTDTMYKMGNGGLCIGTTPVEIQQPIDIDGARERARSRVSSRLYPAEPQKPFMFRTITEQMETAHLDEVPMDEGIKLTTIAYPNMLFDDRSIAHFTLTDMETGDEIWTGAYHMENPMAPSPDSESDSDDDDVRTVFMESDAYDIAEPFAYIGEDVTFHVPLVHNLIGKPGVADPELTAMYITLQRVINPKTGHSLDLFDRACSCAIRRIALCASSELFFRQ